MPEVAELLDRLPTERADDLLRVLELDEWAEARDKDPHGPRLYQAIAKGLLKEGHPATALKVARSGLAIPRYASDLRLKYLVALAHARGGNPTAAAAAIEPLLADSTDPDVIALRGRVFKDQHRRAADPVVRRALAGQAAEWYLKAARLPGADTFPLINAATMRRLEGEVAEANVLAAEVERRAKEAWKASKKNDYWLPATLGEALVLLNHSREAVEWLEKAVDRMLKKVAFGDLAALINNLRLLAEVGATEPPEWIQKKVGAVIAFSGHCLDAPGREVPRFPNDPKLVEKVRADVRAVLEQRNARFAFCSLASGADLIFAEEMLLRKNTEIEAVLPFAAADFLSTSVDFELTGPKWAGWTKRFHKVCKTLRKHGRLHYATTEPYLGTTELFAYTNDIIQGMAVVRAEQLCQTPRALVVLDPSASNASGGTRHFLDQWQRTRHEADVIDLARLRPGKADKTPSGAGPAGTTSAMPRPVRAMLFADVAGFSKMLDGLTPHFFQRYATAVAEVVKAAGGGNLMVNTWGDGLFAVFATAPECAKFATALLERMPTAVEWGQLGFKDANPLRIGLHAGPVYEMERDPVLGRRNYFGQHVNRTARIEPVTVPGCAYASEQFAALLTVQAGGAYQCEFVGVEELAKGYDRVSLYRVNRRNG